MGNFSLRDIAENLFEKHFDKTTSRPIFLPVEWRTRLILDNGLTDHITVRYMEAMRNALNSTAMDIMYYQSPLYRQEVRKHWEKVVERIGRFRFRCNGSVGVRCLFVSCELELGSCLDVCWMSRLDKCWSLVTLWKGRKSACIGLWHLLWWFEYN